MMPFLRVESVRLLPEQIDFFYDEPDTTKCAVVMKSGKSLFLQISSDELEKKLATYWAMINKMMADAQQQQPQTNGRIYKP